MPTFYYNDNFGDPAYSLDCLQMTKINDNNNNKYQATTNNENYKHPSNFDTTELQYVCVCMDTSATISYWIYDYSHQRLVICLFIRCKLVNFLASA